MLDIYGTLGPRCSERETLAAMFAAGMSGVRLNLSHVTLRHAADQIASLHAAAADAGKTAQLLIDMQGPELRVGALEAPLMLEDGASVTLGAGGVPVPALIFPALAPGQELLLDDGKLLLEIVSAGSETASARILRGGVLQSRKSIALPGLPLRPPTMTDTDLETVRAALDEAGASDIRLFAKIENLEGVRNLPELLGACDEIVIARGDLGNAMPLWELPRVQKQIAAACRAAGRPFMVVTQMLASMEHSAVPTRAEVSDVFNAVLDGASSVMVTGETAVGDYPVEVIRTMANTVSEALAYMGN